MLRFYVYAYVRHRDSKHGKAGTPYYIGKGTGNRAWSHCNNDAIQPPTNKEMIVVLETNLTSLGALALERRMIRWYGRIDNKTGVLRNRTDGGEGTSGYKQSADHIAKRCKTGRSKIKKITVTYSCVWCGMQFIRTYTSGDKRQHNTLTHCSKHCINKHKAQKEHRWECTCGKRVRLCNRGKHLRTHGLSQS